MDALKFTFQLPQMTVTIDDGERGAAGGASASGHQGGSTALVVDLEGDDDDDGNGGAGQTSPTARASASESYMVLQDIPLLSAHAVSSSSSSRQRGSGSGAQDLESQPPQSQSQSQQDSQPQSESVSLSLGPLSQVQARQSQSSGRVVRRGRFQAGAGPRPAQKAQELLQKEPHELVKMILDEQKKNERLQKTKKTYLKQMQTLRRKCTRLEKENNKQTLALAPNSHFVVAKRGKQAEGRGARFTLSSWFSVGIRKCLSQVAAADFGLTTMTDISGQTVMRCERKTCAALVYSFRLFMAEALAYAASCSKPDPSDEEVVGAENEDEAVEVVLHGLPAAGQVIREGEQVCSVSPLVSTTHLRHPDAGSSCRWNLVSVGFTNDATNSNIWRRKKLNVCEAKVQWVSNFDALLQGNFSGAVSTRRCTCLGSWGQTQYQ